MEYNPWEDQEDSELSERMEAEDISYRYKKIPMVNWVKRWTQEQFNKIMDGLFKAYGGDRDEY